MNQLLVACKINRNIFFCCRDDATRNVCSQLLHTTSLSVCLSYWLIPHVANLHPGVVSCGRVPEEKQNLILPDIQEEGEEENPSSNLGSRQPSIRSSINNLGGTCCMKISYRFDTPIKLCGCQMESSWSSKDEGTLG